MGEAIRLVAEDGHAFDAYCAAPRDHVSGAIVLFHEIFGLNDHIRSLADDLAADGFAVVAPAMFDRAARGYATGYEPEDVAAGVDLVQRLDWENVLRDATSAMTHAARYGRVGAVGYSWGGGAAWLIAARSSALACAVSYYGGAVPQFADQQPRCPVQCHFGEHDQKPTATAARAACALHSNVEACFYPAGHGFVCDARVSFHAESAATARERMLPFLTRHLEVADLEGRRL